MWQPVLQGGGALGTDTVGSRGKKRPSEEKETEAVERKRGEKETLEETVFEIVREIEDQNRMLGTAAMFPEHAWIQPLGHSLSLEHRLLSNSNSYP